MTRNIYHGKKMWYGAYDYIFDDAWDHWLSMTALLPEEHAINETDVSRNRSILPQIDHFCFMRHHSYISAERV